MTEKFLIINADDYGLCDSVNRGIIECINEGVVSDLSFIINPYSIQNSISLLHYNNIKSVGIHFNLTLGKRNTYQVCNFTNENRQFNKLSKHLINYIYHKLGIEQIYYEFKSQIELLLNNNLKITHIDSHQNIHLLPPIFDILIKIRNDYKLHVPIRYPLEKCKPISKYSLYNLARVLIFNTFSYLLKKKFSIYDKNIQTVGSNFYNNTRKIHSFENILRQIKKSDRK
jgi:hypothetical protein